MIENAARPGLRRGITLVEILISILILGVGLVSLATLFPIGLLRLREAQRQSRSAYLYESAAADVTARGLLNPTSFAYADFLNGTTYTNWYYSQVEAHGIQPADPGYARLTGPMRSCSTRIILRVPSTSRSAPSRLPRAATACRSRTIRSGGGRRITPTAASI